MTSVSTRSSSSSSAASEAMAAACAMVLTPKGTAVLRNASATGSWATAKPTRKTGQAVGLGERAQDGDVRPVAVELDAVGHRRVADELAVGLVEDDQQVARYGVEEALEGAAAHRRAGGVVGRADEDEPGTRGDGREHCVESWRSSAVHGTRPEWRPRPAR